MPVPLSPPRVTTPRPGELPPYLSNGIVGLRTTGLPYATGTTMVGGFAGIEPTDGVEGFARAPSATAIDVQLDGVWASAAPELVQLAEQRYDFATGELTTSWRFTVGTTTATVESIVFCPRTLPALAASDLTVRVSGPANLAISAGLDPTGVPGRGDLHAQPQDQGPNEGVDGRLLWHAPGDISQLGVAYATTFTGS